MICKKCGSNFGYMDGTVERCFCGRWVETRPEVIDMVALKETCQALSDKDNKEPKEYRHYKVKPTSDEQKAHNREVQRAWYAKNREHEIQRKRKEYQAKKQKRAA